jgi:H+/Cl- antiporter ClcA
MNLRKRFNIFTWIISLIAILFWVGLATWFIVDAQQQIKNEETQALLQAGFSQAEIDDYFRQLEPTRKKDILDTITLDRKPDVFDTIEPEGDVFDQIKRAIEKPDNEFDKIFSTPSTKTVPDEFWYCCAAALASFVAIWLIYWVLFWSIRVFHKIGKKRALQIIKWALIIFFASILFHLADHVVHKTIKAFEEKPTGTGIQFKFD